MARSRSVSAPTGYLAITAVLMVLTGWPAAHAARLDLRTRTRAHAQTPLPLTGSKFGSSFEFVDEVWVELPVGLEGRKFPFSVDTGSPHTYLAGDSRGYPEGFNPFREAQCTVHFTTDFSERSNALTGSGVNTRAVQSSNYLLGTPRVHTGVSALAVTQFGPFRIDHMFLMMGPRAVSSNILGLAPASSNSRKFFGAPIMRQLGEYADPARGLHPCVTFDAKNKAMYVGDDPEKSPDITKASGGPMAWTHTVDSYSWRVPVAIKFGDTEYEISTPSPDGKVVRSRALVDTGASHVFAAPAVIRALERARDKAEREGEDTSDITFRIGGRDLTMPYNTFAQMTRSSNRGSNQDLFNLGLPFIRQFIVSFCMDTEAGGFHPRLGIAMRQSQATPLDQADDAARELEIAHAPSDQEDSAADPRAAVDTGKVVDSRPPTAFHPHLMDLREGDHYGRFNADAILDALTQTGALLDASDLEDARREVEYLIRSRVMHSDGTIPLEGTKRRSAYDFMRLLVDAMGNEASFDKTEYTDEIENRVTVIKELLKNSFHCALAGRGRNGYNYLYRPQPTKPPAAKFTRSQYDTFRATAQRKVHVPIVKALTFGGPSSHAAWLGAVDLTLEEGDSERIVLKKAVQAAGSTTSNVDVASLDTNTWKLYAGTERVTALSKSQASGGEKLTVWASLPANGAVSSDLAREAADPYLMYERLEIEKRALAEAAAAPKESRVNPRETTKFKKNKNQVSAVIIPKICELLASKCGGETAPEQVPAEAFLKEVCMDASKSKKSEGIKKRLKKLVKTANYPNSNNMDCDTLASTTVAALPGDDLPTILTILLKEKSYGQFVKSAGSE